jgi:hypothetical protein
MEKINWSNIFNPTHKNWGWFSTCYDAAKEAGYPYMLWNDRIISVVDGADTGWIIEKNKFVNTDTYEEILFI